MNPINARVITDGMEKAARKVRFAILTLHVVKIHIGCCRIQRELIPVLNQVLLFSVP